MQKLKFNGNSEALRKSQNSVQVNLKLFPSMYKCSTFSATCYVINLLQCNYGNLKTFN